MIGYSQVLNEPTYISGSQIYYVYIKKAFLETLHTKTIFQNINVSDHDAVSNFFQNNEVDFTSSK